MTLLALAETGHPNPGVFFEARDVDLNDRQVSLRFVLAFDDIHRQHDFASLAGDNATRRLQVVQQRRVVRGNGAFYGPNVTFTTAQQRLLTTEFPLRGRTATGDHASKHASNQQQVQRPHFGHLHTNRSLRAGATQAKTARGAA